MTAAGNHGSRPAAARAAPPREEVTMSKRVGRQGRPPWRVLALVALVALVAAACGPGRPQQVESCVARRLGLAFQLYDRARDQLARHYEQRLDTALTAAFHNSEDAVVLARATRSCFDFDEVAKRQAVDLIRANLLFQKLVRSNMRDQDPQVVIDLYGSQYREIFKNDIR